MHCICLEADAAGTQVLPRPGTGNKVGCFDGLEWCWLFRLGESFARHLSLDTVLVRFLNFYPRVIGDAAILLVIRLWVSSLCLCTFMEHHIHMQRLNATKTSFGPHSGIFVDMYTPGQTNLALFFSSGSRRCLAPVRRCFLVLLVKHASRQPGPVWYLELLTLSAPLCANFTWSTNCIPFHGT